MTRKYLILACSSLGLIGVTALMYVFVSTMTPNARAELRYQKKIWVRDLGIGEYKLGDFGGIPIYIRKLNEGKYRVLNRVSKYEIKGFSGCAVQVLGPNNEAYFREVCRYAIYDENGKVLDGSMPTALDLEEVETEYTNGFLYAY